MNVTITNENGLTLAKVEGRVDTTTAKDFETHAMKILAGDCSNIVLDCEDLSYVSSSGLRVFLILQKGVMAKKGKLVLKNMNPSILDVFKITGFASIFTIE